MTKSQNTKNEQQKDLCITSEQLTEQWKKGELPEKLYWVEYSLDGINGVDVMHYMPNLGGFTSRFIKEVLAPVPSYDEWKASRKYINGLEEKIEIYERKEKQHTNDSIAYNELAEENEELKEEYEAECRRSDELEDSLHIAWKDIDKLKELLKECESSIQYYQETYGAMDLDTYTLLAKLKEALK